MSDFSSTAEKLARQAGAYAEAHASGVRVSSKGGDYRDVVTEVDLTISRDLKMQLAALYPEHQFYSEEDPTAFDPDQYTWSIDPIDGTANYVRGIPHYSSSVTLLQSGKVITSSVYNPVTDECFILSDEGVRLNGEAVTPSGVTTLHDAYVNFHPGRKTEHRAWAGELKVQLLEHAKKSNNLGSSALDLFFVAAGRTDIVIYGTLSVLDVAGAVAAVRAVGGEVYTYDGRQPVTYTAEPQRILAVANPTLADDYFAHVN